MSEVLIRPPVRWLRPAAELERPPSRFAVLWPATEYTVLVFGRGPREGDGLELDPFERAVVGASAANIVSIVEQAALLNLDQNFVGHLHAGLRERGIFDEYSRPHDPAATRSEDRSILAIHIYQDPWSGALWPRFVLDDRRTLPLTRSSERPRVVAGTTGSPVEIGAFVLTDTGEPRGAPSSDDALHVISEWTRTARRHGLDYPSLPERRAARVVPDSAETVLLCCPNHRGTDGRPDVLDPFGGPEWSPFVRALVTEAHQDERLHNWLYGKAGAGRGEKGELDAERTEPADSRARLSAAAHALAGHDEERRPGPQDRLDLEQTGHLAVDVLLSFAPLEPLDLANAEAIGDLMTRIALTVGFEIEGPIRQPRTTGEAGTLLERCAELLLVFPADRRGPLHELASRRPGFFDDLRSVDAHDNPAGTAQLRPLVKALVDVALDAPSMSGTGAA